MIRRVAVAVAAGAILYVSPAAPAQSPHVDLTWMSIANMLIDADGIGVLVDGYITRIPQSAFYGGGGGLGRSRAAFTPDVPGVTRVFDALGGRGAVDLILTGHSHFDHSFDTATWARLTGAPVIGSPTTCFQAQAGGVPADRCRAVMGGERIQIAPSLALYVVRWNHSGDHAQNPEQHDPVELTAPPRVDPSNGGLHPGVAEDFPNGGGNRAYLFVLDAPGGSLSWFFHDSAAAGDLRAPVVIDGVNYGAPLDNLAAAMKAAGVTSVDLWIGTGGAAVARLVVPVLKPRAFLPVHWDGLYAPFWNGVPQPYADPATDAFLASAGVTVIRPAQYMDKWQLDRTGVHAQPNAAVKRALGFPER